ncbi:uncharacterized protein LOC111085100 isoform X2 [Limulus polyphemus]|uniref:Uncharacterized protein LOC111085100 isoform X2 n=1 Tax=Limulus polyphemus TaxID=6850 RepID=A0ABM1S2X0_LIMPO|nr:uncharacterized protein LOC111085100 isoform X2 [Limulus polyphemus]
MKFQDRDMRCAEAAHVQMKKTASVASLVAQRAAVQKRLQLVQQLKHEEQVLRQLHFEDQKQHLKQQVSKLQPPSSKEKDSNFCDALTINFKNDTLNNLQKHLLEIDNQLNMISSKREVKNTKVLQEISYNETRSACDSNKIPQQTCTDNVNASSVEILHSEPQAYLLNAVVGLTDSKKHQNHRLPHVRKFLSQQNQKQAHQWRLHNQVKKKSPQHLMKKKPELMNSGGNNTYRIRKRKCVDLHSRNKASTHLSDNMSECSCKSDSVVKKDVSTQVEPSAFDIVTADKYVQVSPEKDPSEGPNCSAKQQSENENLEEICTVCVKYDDGILIIEQL